MNQNFGIIDDDHNLELPPPVDALHDQLLPENRGKAKIRRQPPALRPQEYYRGYDNITYSDGPLVLPHLPHGHTFVVASNLMQMLIARGLFSELPFEDPHAQIAKVRSVRKSCVGRPDLNIDVIGLRVFPLPLMGEAAIWFTELPYNSIYTWN